MNLRPPQLSRMPVRYLGSSPCGALLTRHVPDKPSPNRTGDFHRIRLSEGIDLRPTPPWPPRVRQEYPLRLQRRGCLPYSGPQPWSTREFFRLVTCDAFRWLYSIVQVFARLVPYTSGCTLVTCLFVLSVFPDGFRCIASSVGPFTTLTFGLTSVGWPLLGS